MLNNEHILIDILGENVKVDYPSVGTRRAVKELTLDSLCKIMSKSTESKQVKKIYPIGLRVKAENTNRIMVGYEVLEHVGDMKFRKEDTNSRDENSVMSFNSVWPNGMTFIEFERGSDGLRCLKFYQFSLMSPVTSLTDQLYVWPGSNVFDRPDYNICIGHISVDKIQSIEESGNLPFLFYNGISNNDLTSGKFNPYTPEGSKERITHPHVLYRYLEVKDGVEPKPFPYEILKQALTINEFLKNHGY